MEPRPARRTWDLTKVVTPLLTVLGISVGAWQFSSQMSHESTMEFSRSMYNKKLQAYEEVGKAVGDLLVVPHDEQLCISAADTLAFDSCLERFRTCYWSVLPLVEDSVVETAMIQFKDMARFYRRGENDYHDLAREGMTLMNACNNSLERHWRKKQGSECGRVGARAFRVPADGLPSSTCATMRSCTGRMIVAMRNLLPFVALLAALPAVAQPGPFLPGDLQYALHVCTDTSYTTLQGEAGPGEVADLDAINRGCLVVNELNGVWMHVQVATAGQLAFTLTPAVTGDLDFGVWGPFSAPVTALVAPPVRCSYAAGNGATGMNYTAMDLSEFAGGDRWVRYLDVLPGEWYMVYINQFSSTGLNFALNWDLQGGASLACLEAPVADFTGPVGPVPSGSLVDFTDMSINHPYAWYWQFPTGVPTTSLEPDPQGIVFSTPGCHPVQLTVYNAVGSSTTTVPCAVEVEVNTGVASVDPAAFVLRQEAGQLRVLPVDASRVAVVRVVDLRGRVVATTTGAGEQVVPLGNITPGVYAVEVVQDGIRTTRAVAFGH